MPDEVATPDVTATSEGSTPPDPAPEAAPADTPAEAAEAPVPAGTN